MIAAETALDGGDGRGRAEPPLPRVTCRGRQVGAAQHSSLRLRIVADQAEREFVVGLEQHLPADQPAVAVVDVAAGNHVVEEAVALDVNRVEANGDRAGDRSGGAGHAAKQIEVADVDLRREFRREGGFAVMIEIRPAEVLRPNSVPCGPRRTSMRSSGPRSVRPMPVRER